MMENCPWALERHNRKKRLALGSRIMNQDAKWSASDGIARSVGCSSLTIKDFRERHFRAHLSAAPLKRLPSADQTRTPPTFPRSSERDPIEVRLQRHNARTHRKFPRSSFVVELKRSRIVPPDSEYEDFPLGHAVSD